MATINVGKLTFTHKGDYSSSTAYVLNDVVYYNGSAYIAKQSTTNNVPTNGTYWSQFSAGSGGIWNSGLSMGSAGSAVKVNAAGNALEFGTAGGVIQRKIATDTSTGTLASNTPQRWTPFNLSLTPTTAGNIIELEIHDYWSSQGTQWGGYFYDQTNGVKIAIGNPASSRPRLSFINGINNNVSWVGFAGARAYYAAPNTNATDFAVYIGTHSGTTFYHNRNEQHTDNADIDNAYVSSSFTITEYASSVYTGSNQVNV